MRSGHLFVETAAPQRTGIQSAHRWRCSAHRLQGWPAADWQPAALLSFALPAPRCLLQQGPKVLTHSVSLLSGCFRTGTIVIIISIISITIVIISIIIISSIINGMISIIIRGSSQYAACMNMPYDTLY